MKTIKIEYHLDGNSYPQTKQGSGKVQITIISDGTQRSLPGTFEVLKNPNGVEIYTVNVRHPNNPMRVLAQSGITPIRCHLSRLPCLQKSLRIKENSHLSPECYSQVKVALMDQMVRDQTIRTALGDQTIRTAKVAPRDHMDQMDLVNMALMDQMDQTDKVALT